MSETKYVALLTPYENMVLAEVSELPKLEDEYFYLCRPVKVTPAYGESATGESRIHPDMEPYGNYFGSGLGRTFMKIRSTTFVAGREATAAERDAYLQFTSGITLAKA